MRFIKQLLPLIAVGCVSLWLSDTWAQEPKAEPVYLEELAEEPPPAVVRHRKAQAKFDNGQLRLEREEALLSDDTVVSDGAYIEYYEDGQKFCQGEYENGVINGEWTYWHPNGQVCKVIQYKKGKPDGAIEVFRADGTLDGLQSYSNGVRDGEWISYYEDGKTPKIKLTIIDGKLDGERTTYFPNGKPKQETHFAGGVLDGTVTEYNEAGKKVGEATFEKGQRTSTKQFD